MFTPYPSRNTCPTTLERVWQSSWGNCIHPWWTTWSTIFVTFTILITVFFAQNYRDLLSARVFPYCSLRLAGLAHIAPTLQNVHRSAIHMHWHMTGEADPWRRGSPQPRGGSGRLRPRKMRVWISGRSTSMRGSGNPDGSGGNGGLCASAALIPPFSSLWYVICALWAQG